MTKQKNLKSLPVCNTKMPSILVKQITIDYFDPDMETFVKKLLESTYAVVANEKDIVFSYYEADQTIRKKIVDNIIHRELMDHAIHVLLECPIIDIYMKYDEEDSWRVRITEDGIFYFTV